LAANTLVRADLVWYGLRHYEGMVGNAQRAPHESAASATKPAPQQKQRSSTAGARLSRGPLEALTMKDLLIFLRDPAQLGHPCSSSCSW